jgi:diadenosine tetraphosphate (Ap4A) HIT family hydrolase
LLVPWTSNPSTPATSFFLVVPDTHTKFLEDLPEETRAQMFRTTQLVAAPYYSGLGFREVDPLPD